MSGFGGQEKTLLAAAATLECGLYILYQYTLSLAFLTILTTPVLKVRPFWRPKRGLFGGRGGIAALHLMTAVASLGGRGDTRVRSLFYFQRPLAHPDKTGPV